MTVLVRPIFGPVDSVFFLPPELYFYLQESLRVRATVSIIWGAC